MASLTAEPERPGRDQPPEDEAAYLPDTADPYWDELTADTTRQLARLRRGHRRQRLGSIATLVYGLLLIGFFYGASYASYTLHAAESGHPYGRFSPQILLAAPAGLLAGCALLLVALARDATWRGPVLLDEASVLWLLPLPIRRAALLRPKLWFAAGVAAVAGALLGAALGFVAHVTDLGPLGGDVAAGVAGVTLIALLGTAVATLVERYAGEPGSARRQALLWAAPVLLAGQAALAAGGRASTVAQAVELWSGPWGWAAQPLVVAVRAPGGDWLSPPIALALLALLTLAALVAAHRQVGAISYPALRARAGTMASVRGALYAVELRQAGLAVQAARGAGFRRGLRLRPPRWRWALVPWRDLTALLRAPGRVAWSALALFAALGLTLLAARAHGAQAMVVALLLALVAGYLAAAQLVESARLDGDDPRRAAALPYPFAVLAMWHAVVPCCVLLGLGAVGVGLAVLAGAPALPGLLVVALTPGLVGAALVSAYRGPTPAGLLVGVETPTGNTGPAQVVVWYLRGPLTVIGFGVVQFVLALRADARGGGLGHVLAEALPWSVLAAFVFLGWARRRAQRLQRS